MNSPVVDEPGARAARAGSPSGSCGSTSPAQTAKSVTALANLSRLCETHLAGRYEIEVIDLLVNPQLAAGDQILAVPTLVRKFPEPIRKIIGDLSNEERVLVGLDVRAGEIDERRRGRRAAAPAGRVVLSLYICGPTPRSAEAMVNIRQLCEAHLRGRYDLRVVDLSQAPALAARHQIIAAPTLVRELPLPERKFIGDMSNSARILRGLDVVAA